MANPEILREINQARRAGETIEQIAQRLGKSPRTVYRYVSAGDPLNEDIPCRLPKSIRRPAPAPKGEPLITYEEGIAQITSMLTEGKWRRSLVPHLAELWQVPVYEVRAWTIDALAARKTPLDPYRLSVELQVAVVAAAKAGQICAKLIGDSVTASPLERSLSASEAHSRLVSLGWTPPPPKGLPAPDLGDPDAIDVNPPSPSGA